MLCAIIVLLLPIGARGPRKGSVCFIRDKKHKIDLNKNELYSISTIAVRHPRIPQTDEARAIPWDPFLFKGNDFHFLTRNYFEVNYYHNG